MRVIVPVTTRSDGSADPASLADADRIAREAGERLLAQVASALPPAPGRAASLGGSRPEVMRCGARPRRASARRRKPAPRGVEGVSNAERKVPPSLRTPARSTRSARGSCSFRSATSARGWSRSTTTTCSGASPSSGWAEQQSILIIGVTLLGLVAALRENRGLLRALSIFTGLTSLALIAGLGLFALDTVQLRGVVQNVAARPQLVKMAISASVAGVVHAIAFVGLRSRCGARRVRRR